MFLFLNVTGQIYASYNLLRTDTVVGLIEGNLLLLAFRSLSIIWARHLSVRTG